MMRIEFGTGLHCLALGVEVNVVVGAMLVFSVPGGGGAGIMERRSCKILEIVS